MTDDVKLLINIFTIAHFFMTFIYVAICYDILLEALAIIRDKLKWVLKFRNKKNR